MDCPCTPRDPTAAAGPGVQLPLLIPWSWTVSGFALGSVLGSKQILAAWRESGHVLKLGGTHRTALPRERNPLHPLVLSLKPGLAVFSQVGAHWGQGHLWGHRQDPSVQDLRVQRVQGRGLGLQQLSRCIFGIHDQP